MSKEHEIFEGKPITNAGRQADTVVSRLIRLESKLVRGFEELGIALTQDSDWLTVDEDHLTVHVKTLGRSLSTMLRRMHQCGALSVGSFYKIKYRGKTIGSIALNYPE